MTFAKNLARCTRKTCWILQRVLCAYNLVIRLIKCIRLNCILMPRRYAKVGRRHPKHCYITIRGRRVPKCSCCILQRPSKHDGTLWQRYQQSCSTNDGPRSGRPRIINPVEDRYIRVFQPRHKTVTSSQAPSSIHGLRRISAKTVLNRLREHDVGSHISCQLVPIQSKVSVARF